MKKKFKKMCDNKINIFEIIINEKYDLINNEHYDN